MEYGIRSIFYATEKDIFDAVMSAKQRVTADFLLSELAGLGVFRPDAESREELAEFYSLVPHDYFLFDSLAEKIERTARKERMRSITLGENVSKDDLAAVVRNLKQELGPSGEAIAFTAGGAESKADILRYEYTEIDYGRTPLRQKQARDANIEFERLDSGETLVRFPDNNKVSCLVHKSIAFIEQEKGTATSFNEISLEGFSDPKKRTEFFVLLLRSLDGFDLTDVNKVEVFRTLSEDGTEEYVSTSKSEAEDIEGYVRKVALDGGGLLYSSEYRRLEDEGFYIAKIVWTSAERKIDGSLFRFEAAWALPETGAGLRYSVRGYYPKVKSGDYAVARSAVTSGDERRLNRVLEAAAKTALDAVTGFGDEEE